MAENDRLLDGITVDAILDKAGEEDAAWDERLLEAQDAKSYAAGVEATKEKYAKLVETTRIHIVTVGCSEGCPVWEALRDLDARKV